MPSAVILYQYFHPDDVVSAVHLTGLAAGLADRGWQVTVFPCNRSCRSSQTYSLKETYREISIRRIWRPPLPQKTSWGRIANCLWMLTAWTLLSAILKPDVLIIGTDPVMSALVAVPWHWMRSHTRIVHWCFDLYPEAALADGLLKPGIVSSLLHRLMKASYKRIDLVVDIGKCMKKLIRLSGSFAKDTTLPPWALVEPPSPLPIDLTQRTLIFKQAKLALMYSGNFGRAHSFREVISIARMMAEEDIQFAFSIRGNREQELRDAVVTGDENIVFVPFAPQTELLSRLSSADIQLVTLQPEWTGTVVPSKFFGALAAGRPVLFIGSKQCWISELIEEYGLGWTCSQGEESKVAAQLREVVNNIELLVELQQRCHQTYQLLFARDVIVDSFDRQLRLLLDCSHPSATSLNSAV